MHFPLHYVAATWLRHRKHGTYPEPGGYNDQDELLMSDWDTLDSRMSEIMRRGRTRSAFAEYTDTDTPKNDWMTAFG